MHRVLFAGIVLALAARDVDAQQFQFMSPAPRTPTSPLPSSISGYVASGDLDGDGRSDLVASIGGSACVFHHPATGWTQGQVLPWSPWAPQPVLIDLDADGDRDLVFVPPRLPVQMPVAVLRRSASGFTLVSLPWSSTTLVHAAALGNIDGDAFVDMIVATIAGSVTPSLVVVRGGPGLQFTPDMTATPMTLPYGLWPALVDGDLDVLAAHVSGSLHLLRNVGGSFVDATGSLGPTGSGYTDLIAADLDGDGREDCAASRGNAVDVFWGGPTGLTFSPAVAQVAGVVHLARGDFDGDRDVDLLAEHGSGLDVLWSVGQRQFTASRVVQSPAFVLGVIDEDGDGGDDVVFALVRGGTTRCKLKARIEDAAWELHRSVTNLPLGPMLAGDVDGDGRTDHVIPGYSDITVDHAHGDGTYHRTTSPPLLIQQSGIAELADLDTDGDLDLVLKNPTALAIASNDGSGNFVSTLLRASTSYGHDDLRVADLDADGDRDIVHADTRGAVCERNDGSGQWASVVLMPGANCVEVADVDGDGDPDLIAHSGINDMLTVLPNDGQGNFGAPQPFAGSAVKTVRAGDFDGDGDVDLACSGGFGGRVTVHRNNGSGVFTDTSAADLPAVLPSTRGNLVMADLDGDGDLDLAIASLSTLGCLLLLNDGSGRFADRTAVRLQPLPTDPFGQQPNWRVRAADIDDDGDVDLTFVGALLSQPFVFHEVSHIRQLRSNAAPRLGGVADFHLSSGPGFGAPGLALLGVDFAPVPIPLRVPGIEGKLELDPNTVQIVASMVTSPVGLSSAFVGVPQNAALFGLELWFQGAILPSVGAPGFTNAVYEVILR